MSFVKLIGATATGGGTYYAIRNKNIPLIAKVGISLVASGAGYYGTGKIVDLVAPNMGKAQVGAAKTEAQEILKNNAHLPPGEQIKASYSKQQMIDYANKLFTAMDGEGTDEDAVDSVFKAMNNDLDILNLIQEFGTRAGTSWFASSTPDDLGTWLAGDGITERVNNILKTKTQITKRF